MKRFYTFFLFLGLLAGTISSCGSDDNNSPDDPDNPEGPVLAPNVSILNLDNAQSCLPDSKISLKARLVKPTEVHFQWSVDGKEVSTDSVYDFSASKEGKYLIHLAASNTEGESSDTLSIRVIDGFSFADIQNWTGEGENQSALVIQWTTAEDLLHPTDDEVFALAWGYHWKENDSPTGISMLKAIVQHDPRLYVILAEAWGGIVIKGFGYDGDNDGKIEIKNATLHLTQEDFDKGIYWQQQDETSEEDIDALVSLNDKDYWQGGWYVAYASYWLGSGEAVLTPGEYNYSQVIASGRYLSNNSWDAWTFSPINEETKENISPIPRLLQAAPNE